MNRKESILKILDDLDLFYKEINQLIKEYETMVPWLGNTVQEVNIEKSWKMATDQKYLYVCQCGTMCVARYTVDDLKLVDKFPLSSYAVAIDISGNELYVYDYNVALKVFNINTKDIIRQWKPLTKSFAIKIHGENLYYGGDNGIVYVYNLSGVLIKQFSSGSRNGEFFECDAYGIDLDDKFIYVVDNGNFQVRVFDLENYTFSHQWGSKGTGNGQFSYPYEVTLYQGLCYVGDTCGIQVFTKDGQFLYRFGKTTQGSGQGEFNVVIGILVVSNRLYVSDFRNNRLVVLE